MCCVWLEKKINKTEMKENTIIESERKFHLRKLPNININDIYAEYVIQSYYEENGKWSRVGNIIQNPELLPQFELDEKLKQKVVYIHNSKEFIKTGSSLETERYLERKEYLEYLDKCTKEVIKTRYFIPIDGYTWEVDIYHNMNLCIAEVEADESILFDIPIPKLIKDVMITEVTDNKSYLNVNLSI